MLLMMRTPDPLCRLRVPDHRAVIPQLRRRARRVVGGTAAGRIALLDVGDACCSQGVREDVFGDAVCDTYAIIACECEESG